MRAQTIITKDCSGRKTVHRTNYGLISGKRRFCNYEEDPISDYFRTVIKEENEKREVFAKDNRDYEKFGDDFEDRTSCSQERMVQKDKIFDNIPKDEGLEKDL